jgi:GDP-L-fucose synthase
MPAAVIGWEGQFVFDATKPDGTGRKLLDMKRLRRFGWEPPIRLEEGIRTTYHRFESSLGESVRLQ